MKKVRNESKVQVGKDQEKAQSEKDSHSKNRGGKKTKLTVRYFCSTYRPPNTYSSWIDLFEEELSIAQATGLEIILMGDFNIDLNTSTNNKWIHLIQPFDLSQLATEPTHVTETTATIIDHIYMSNPENTSNCFVSRLSISDHFPICFSRKVNHKLAKNKHTINSYRSYKHFDETKFLVDLSLDLDNFEISYTNTVEDDLAAAGQPP